MRSMARIWTGYFLSIAMDGRYSVCLWGRFFFFDLFFFSSVDQIVISHMLCFCSLLSFIPLYAFLLIL